jgi:membrane-bound hydrogenase subunit alpha
MKKQKTSYEIPIGPIHPALKEPVKFNFEIEGERIVDVDVELGHVHRAVEWAATRRNPIQILYLAERVCGICSYCHPMAFALATERAADIKVPVRAQYIRVVHQELERICSHVLWAGVAAHEIGFDTVLYLTWNIREAALDLTEHLTGSRVTKGITMIGGVRRDITKDMHPYINKKLSVIKNNFEKLRKIFLEDKTFKIRSQDCGILTKKDAIKLCAVGPTARASGVKKDTRIDQPYFSFGDFDIEYMTPDIITGEINGDVYDRIIVRLLEVKQSVEIILEAIDRMPDGEIVEEKKLVKLLNQLKKVEGEGIGRMEAPRGEVFHYVKYVGSESPYTWKIRAPTYSNIMPWVPMLKGEQIADIPIVAASTDPCMSCTNRVGIIKDGKKTHLNSEQLHNLSVEKTKKLIKLNFKNGGK